MNQINFTMKLIPNAEGWDAQAYVTLGDVQAQFQMSYLTVERYAEYFANMKEHLAARRKDRTKD